MTSTSIKTSVPKAKTLSTSTALVSLSKTKAKVTKPSKVVRTNVVTTKELISLHNIDMRAIKAEGNYKVIKAQLVAKLNAVLLHMAYDAWTETQRLVKAQHMADSGTSQAVTDTWWSKLGLSVKKPKSPNAEAVKKQVVTAKGAKQVKGAPVKKDGRITPLSAKLSEIKTAMLKNATHKQVYSTKAGQLLNLALAEFILCEKVDNETK